ncbi:MAG: tetratricopeptide repeat protein, partial [Bacteroidota bacterium]
MKYFFKLSFLILLVTNCPAQHLKDEYKALVENTSDPVHRIQLINRLNQKLLFIQDPKLIHYAKEALHLADELDLEEPQIEASSHLGMLFLYQAKYVESLKFFLKALSVAEKLQDDRFMAIANLQLGHLLLQLKQYDKAFEHLEKALLLARNTQSYQLQAETKWLFSYLYFLKANAGTSQRLAFEALHLSQKSSDSTLCSKSHLMLGKIYLSKNQIDKADQALKAARKFLGTEPSPYVKAILYFYQGQLLFQQNKTKEAIVAFEQGRLLSEKISARALNRDIYQALANGYESLNNLPKTIHYLRLEQIYQDSLNQSEQVVQLSQIMKNYDFNPNSYRQAAREAGIVPKDRPRRSYQWIPYLLFPLFAFLSFFLVYLGLRLYRLQKSRHQLILENQGFSLDIERTQYEKEKLAALKREQDNRIKNVAHDLKAPLNRVYGLTELIHMEADNLLPEQVKYLNLISQVSFDAQIMVQNWLDTKKIEEQQLAIQLSKVNLSELLMNLIVGYKQQASKKSIQLHFDNLSDTPFYLFSDINLIARILDNLLSNAIALESRLSKI